MVAQIKNWQEAFKIKCHEYQELEKGFNNAIAEIVKLNDEIARLKAELASKPVYPHVEIKTKPKPWSECAFEKNGSYCRHCGRGVKKESEEKNDKV